MPVVIVDNPPEGGSDDMDPRDAQLASQKGLIMRVISEINLRENNGADLNTNLCVNGDDFLCDVAFSLDSKPHVDFNLTPEEKTELEKTKRTTREIRDEILRILKTYT